ncbi:actin organization and endocytosis protein, partial [Irineochytrium annulatum]
MSSAPLKPLTPQLTPGSSPAPGASRVTDGFMGPMTSRAAAVSSPKQLRAADSAGVVWAVTPAEKQQYDGIFKVWDPTNSGFVSGERARSIFSQSGLADNVLGHIWTLADTQNTGKLNSNEFAVAMHLIYKKLNGSDLPKVLPPELIPPSTRALDSMAALMKSQLISDITTKKANPSLSSSSLFGSAGSITGAEDPLFAGFVKQGSKTTLPGHDTRKALEARQEEDRKELAGKLEAKKKELASIQARRDASGKASAEVERDIERCRRESENGQEAVVWEVRIRNRLVEEVKALVVPGSSGAAKVGSGIGREQFEAEVRDQERGCGDLIEECRRLELALANKKAEVLKARDMKRGGSGSATPSAGGGSAADRTAALLAARMAALGVTAPVLGVNASSSPSSGFASPGGGGGPSTLAADLAKVEDERRSAERVLDDVQFRVRQAVDRARSVGASLSAGGSGGGSAAGILASVKGWNPAVEDKIRFEDGIGIRNSEVRAMVDIFKKGTPELVSTDLPLLPSPSSSGFPTSTSAGGNSAGGMFERRPSASFTLLERRPSGSSSLLERRPSGNSFDPFAAAAALSASKGASPTPSPFGGFGASATSNFTSPLNSPYGAAPSSVDTSSYGYNNSASSPAPLPSSTNAFGGFGSTGDTGGASSAAAKVAALSSVLAQTEAAVRAAKERADQRAGAMGSSGPTSPTSSLSRAGSGFFGSPSPQAGSSNMTSSYASSGANANPFGAREETRDAPAATSAFSSFNPFGAAAGMAAGNAQSPAASTPVEPKNHVPSAFSSESWSNPSVANGASSSYNVDPTSTPFDDSAPPPPPVT